MRENLSDDIKDLVDSMSTRSFLDIAKKLINLLEIKEIENKVFLPNLHTLLIDLYAAGHKLSPISIKYSNDFICDKASLSIDKKENKHNISNLGTKAFYWEIFDPYFKESKQSEEDIKPILGSLIDDLNDIYHDLKVELFKINHVGTNAAIEDALWHLKWGFNAHWGNHCIDALRALHYLDYEGKVDVE